MDLAVLVVANLRHAEGPEDIAMALDLDSPFSFPSPRGLLARYCQGPGGGAVKCRSIPHRHSERSQTCQEIKAVSKHRRYAFWTRRSAKAKEGDDCLAASMDQLLTRSCTGFDFPAADLDPAPRCFGNKDDRPTWAGALGLTQPLSSSLTSRPVQPAAVAQMVEKLRPNDGSGFSAFGFTGLGGGEDAGPDGRQLRPGESYVGSVPSVDSPGRADCPIQSRPNRRPQLWELSSQHSGVSGPCPSPGRTCISLWKLLFECASSNFQENAAYSGFLRDACRDFGPTRYMEPFGACGRQRDLGLVLFQVMIPSSRQQRMQLLCWR